MSPAKVPQMAYEQHHHQSQSIVVRCAVVTLSDTRTSRPTPAGAHPRMLVAEGHAITHSSILPDDPRALRACWTGDRDAGRRRDPHQRRHGHQPSAITPSRPRTSSPCACRASASCFACSAASKSQAARCSPRRRRHRGRKLLFAHARLDQSGRAGDGEADPAGAEALWWELSK